MTKLLSLMAGLFLAAGAAVADVLIVADEFPAMELLARKLKAQENLACRIVAQTNMPKDLSAFRAVIVYIHGKLNEPAELALIAYTQSGGRLVALHHSISSGKRVNQEWFRFLGVELPPGDVAAGGYKWIEPVTLEVVNLAPQHFITTNQVSYPEQLEFDLSDSARGRKVPGFTLKESEVYLNHRLTEPRTLLLGFTYRDPKTAKVWMQNTAGWMKPAGQGTIVYLKPGHSALDFENPAYARIVINAVVFKP